jgi:hypothetical protein
MSMVPVALGVTKLVWSLCVGKPTELHLQSLAGLKQVVTDGVKQIDRIALRQILTDSLNNLRCLLDWFFNQGGPSWHGLGYE